MTEKESSDSSSGDSGKYPPGSKKKKSEKKEWFHDSSLTESEALRAMIGKQQKKVDEDNNDTYQ